VKIAVIYVYPDLRADTYPHLARRFVSSYMEFPPGQHDHDLHVVVNLGQPQFLPNYQRVFNPLRPQFMMHDNRGQDIGAYQLAAQKIDCDLMVFLGSPIRCRQAGWLDRIIRVYEENGPALYGPWAFHHPRAHVRTTAFWCPPQLLNSYPYIVTSGSRYEFEHGQNNIVNHVSNLGLYSYMVTWRGCFPIEQWHHVENQDCLLLDQFTDRMGYQ
jgi:hypothetical protein